eukprot:TRINITY_DN12117_c0_g1_i1.p1 TRINITY_DN12117_c0_g1~~TRINITY_DN12117_c0_g1_i1.p1  ORF type:complete len:516 (+),score=118.61 TRINITY_DN12117_c0_g1_i1:39-1586(+)
MDGDAAAGARLEQPKELTKEHTKEHKFKVNVYKASTVTSVSHFGRSAPPSEAAPPAAPANEVVETSDVAEGIGPEDCRRRWIECLGASYRKHLSSYSNLRKSLHVMEGRDTLNDVLERALDLKPRGPQGVISECTRSLLLDLHLRHPEFRCAGERDKLRRVLAVFISQNRYLGFDKDLALLAAMTMVVMHDEKESYAILAAVYDEFKLCECYLPEAVVKGDDRNARFLEKDVKQVFQSFRELCPSASKEVAHQRCNDQIQAITGSFMKTFVLVGFNPDRQAFKDFLPLLDSIISTPRNKGDPRSHLRHVVLSVLVTNSYKITAQHGTGRLKRSLEELALDIECTPALMKVTSEVVQPWRCVAYQRSCALPFGVLAGWGASLQMSSLLGTTSYSFGPLGVVMGAILAFRFASEAHDVSVLDQFQKPADGQGNGTITDASRQDADTLQRDSDDSEKEDEELFAHMYKMGDSSKAEPEAFARAQELKHFLFMETHVSCRGGDEEWKDSDEESLASSED